MGVICYYLYYFLILTCNHFTIDKLSLSFFQFISDNKSKINLKEIIFVSVLAIPLGFIFVFIIDYKLLFRIAHLLQFSNNFSDIDV